MTLKSLIAHFNILKWIQGRRNSYNVAHRTFVYRFVSVLLWMLLVLIKVLDILGVFYLIDEIRKLVFKTRKLSEFEIQESRKVFGDEVNWKRVKVRENSWMAKRGAVYAGKKHIGFVLFRTVNFSRKLNHDDNKRDMPWLIHELVHVQQFKHLGFQYILEALRAQNTAGYSYDGVKGLSEVESLEQLNLEQQAEVAKHYYQRLIANEEVDRYRSFIEEIKQGVF